MENHLEEVVSLPLLFLVLVPEVRLALVNLASLAQRRTMLGRGRLNHVESSLLIPRKLVPLGNLASLLDQLLPCLSVVGFHSFDICALLEHTQICSERLPVFDLLLSCW